MMYDAFSAVVSNHYTGRREKPYKVIKTHLNMGMTVHMFRQSLLEGNRSVALRCSHEK